MAGKFQFLSVVTGKRDKNSERFFGFSFFQLLHHLQQFIGVNWRLFQFLSVVTGPRVIAYPKLILVLVSFSCYQRECGLYNGFGVVLVSFSCYFHSRLARRMGFIVLVSFSCYAQNQTQTEPQTQFQFLSVVTIDQQLSHLFLAQFQFLSVVTARQIGRKIQCASVLVSFSCYTTQDSSSLRRKKFQFLSVVTHLQKSGRCPLCLFQFLSVVTANFQVISTSSSGFSFFQLLLKGLYRLGSHFLFQFLSVVTIL